MFGSAFSNVLSQIPELFATSINASFDAGGQILAQQIVEALDGFGVR